MKLTFLSETVRSFDPKWTSMWTVIVDFLWNQSEGSWAMTHGPLRMGQSWRSSHLDRPVYYMTVHFQSLWSSRSTLIDRLLWTWSADRTQQTQVQTCTSSVFILENSMLWQATRQARQFRRIGSSKCKSNVGFSKRKSFENWLFWNFGTSKRFTATFWSNLS